MFSPTIGRQLLELGLIDEIDLHIVPVLLGDGIRRLEQQPRFAVHRPGNSVASPRSHGVPRRSSSGTTAGRRRPGRPVVAGFIGLRLYERLLRRREPERAG